MKNSTKDKFFLDTCLIVYLFDQTDARKQQIARDLMKKALETRNGMVSFQVIQEFCNVALRKFATPMLPDDLKTFLNRFLYPICETFPSLELYDCAIEIHKSFGYGFYDALIIAAARERNCGILYSEDMQDGQQVLGVNIINPFSNSCQN